MEVDQELASILEMGDVYNSTREVEWIAATERRKFLQEAMGRSVPVVGRLRRRLRRNKDAATLLELSTRLETIQRDTLYMSEEVSLSGTASRIWDDLGSKFDDKKAGSVLQQAMMDCGAAMQDLGKAAQASMTGAPGAAADDSLASAGERARLGPRSSHIKVLLRTSNYQGI